MIILYKFIVILWILLLSISCASAHVKKADGPAIWDGKDCFQIKANGIANPEAVTFDQMRISAEESALYIAQRDMFFSITMEATQMPDGNRCPLTEKSSRGIQEIIKSHGRIIAKDFNDKQECIILFEVRFKGLDKMAKCDSNSPIF